MVRLTHSALLLVLVGFNAVCADDVDFNRDIRPIIADNCFACHGFDANAREADLRLDTREGATADLGGYAAVVPGKPDKSELLRRIRSRDPDEVMPPADSHKKPLDKRSIELITKWIEQGAPWGDHWAFIKPVKANVPQDVHPIDFFVRQSLAQHGLAPAQRAPAHVLARRLSFDLVGLPPLPRQSQGLVQDASAQNYGRLVEELLESPHYGERMAMWWLDGARYSDTDGFQQDATRTNWPWRDWVVDAFNRNMSFDEFTIQQFAGDLLPDATAEHRLATCFHRNHMNNGEGGRDPEESRIDYVIDRVNTFGTLWLGLTLGCTQCHDHKFDAISQKDYYSLAAYFNSIDETGAAGGKAGPYLKYRSPHGQEAVKQAQTLANQSKQRLEAIRQEAEIAFDTWLQQQIKSVQSGFNPWTPVRPRKLATTEGYPLTCSDGVTIVSAAADPPQDDYLITMGPNPPLDRLTALRLEVLPHPDHSQGKYSYADTGEFVLTNVKLRVRKRGSSQYREVALARAIADTNGTGLDTKYGNVSGTLDDDPRTGWTTRTKPADVVHQAVFEFAEPVRLAEDEELDIILMQRSLAPQELIGRFRLSLTNQRGAAVRSLDPMPLEQLSRAVEDPADLERPPRPNKLTPQLRQKLRDQFLEDHLPWQKATSYDLRVRSQLNSAKKAAGDLNVMVLAQRQQPRETHILQRGVWDKKGPVVTPAILSSVMPGRDAPTRLELAQWVVSSDNPLTARVIVNQVWQVLFGAGLVRTANDFGFQGEPPTHPELLDWLAVEFVESGWDVKHLLRVIVTSETYQQDSRANEQELQHDPDNRWLARGARFRLPSWMIRDAALRASGLLNTDVGGPPIFPYQPEGVWKDQFMGRFTYQPTLGPSQYRRTLYAFWRRSSAPTFLFDAAMRRTCEVTPRRTNTPLHALILMNDLTSLEAARNLADLAVKAQPDNSQQRIQWICRRVLSRQAKAAELQVLRKQYEKALAYYQDHVAEAEAFTTVGQLKTAGDPKSEIAATMLLTNLVLNLDEAITHE